MHRDSHQVILAKSPWQWILVSCTNIGFEWWFQLLDFEDDTSIPQHAMHRTAQSNDKKTSTLTLARKVRQRKSKFISDSQCSCIWTLVLSKTAGKSAKLDWRHVLKSDVLSLLPGPLFSWHLNRNHKMSTLALTEGPNKLQASVSSLWRLALLHRPHLQNPPCPCADFGPTQVFSKYCEIVQNALSPFWDKCSRYVQDLSFCHMTLDIFCLMFSQFSYILYMFHCFSIRYIARPCLATAGPSLSCRGVALRSSAQPLAVLPPAMCWEERDVCSGLQWYISSFMIIHDHSQWTNHVLW